MSNTRESRGITCAALIIRSIVRCKPARSRSRSSAEDRRVHRNWQTPHGRPWISPTREGAGATRFSIWIARSSCAGVRRAARRAKMRGLPTERNRPKPTRRVAHNFRTAPVPAPAPIRSWIQRRHSLHRAQFDVSLSQRFEQARAPEELRRGIFLGPQLPLFGYVVQPKVDNPLQGLTPRFLRRKPDPLEVDRKSVV